MRRTILLLALLPVLVLGAVPVGAAWADEAEVLRRLEVVAAALDRVEVAAAALAARLDRLDRRLSEVEALLERIEERTRAAQRAEPPAGPDGSLPADAGAGAPGETEAEVRVLQVVVRNKRLWTSPETGDEYLVVDVEAAVRGLRRAGRIKGTFHLTDRFDAPKRSLDYTTGVLRPGERIIERGLRLRLSRSSAEDRWLRAADLREVAGRFEITEVLYGVDLQDGGR